jgi:hypothetical protein
MKSIGRKNFIFMILYGQMRLFNTVIELRPNWQSEAQSKTPQT